MSYEMATGVHDTIHLVTFKLVHTQLHSHYSRSLMVGISIQLQPLFVFVSSYDSGETLVRL